MKKVRNLEHLPYLPFLAGHVVGHFYDKEGKPTENLENFHTFLEAARKDKQSDEDDKQRFPPCNFEYRQGSGRRIWCSELR